MERTKRLVAMMLSVFMLCAVMTVSMHTFAYAETVLQDGIEVTLTTDKESYEALEVIDARLTVRNTTAESMQNVEMKISAPEGYLLLDDSVAKDAELKPGETQSQQSSMRDTNAAVPDLPKTGDDSSAMLWALLFAMSAGVLCVLLARNPQRKRIFSLILCFVMVGSIVLEAVPVYAQADDMAMETKSIIVNKEIIVDGETVVLTGAVAFEQPVKVNTVSASPVVSGFKLNNVTENAKVRTGDKLTFSGMISAAEGTVISSVQVFIYDATSEVPYSMGEKYYDSTNLNAAQFDLANVPEMTVGEEFGESDYALTEGGRYVVMLYATDSEGNTFVDMDTAITGNQGPTADVRVLMSPENCDHSAKEYTYELDDAVAPRVTANDDGMTHQVEPCYSRYCADCGTYLMDIWGSGTSEEHSMADGTCTLCGFNAMPMMMSARALPEIEFIYPITTCEVGGTYTFEWEGGLSEQYIVNVKLLDGEPDESSINEAGISLILNRIVEETQISFTVPDIAEEGQYIKCHVYGETDSIQTEAGSAFYIEVFDDLQPPYFEDVELYRNLISTNEFFGLRGYVRDNRELDEIYIYFHDINDNNHHLYYRFDISGDNFFFLDEIHIQPNDGNEAWSKNGEGLTAGNYSVGIRVYDGYGHSYPDEDELLHVGEIEILDAEKYPEVDVYAPSSYAGFEPGETVQVKWIKASEQYEVQVKVMNDSWTGADNDSGELIVNEKNWTSNTLSFVVPENAKGEYIEIKVTGKDEDGNLTQMPDRRLIVINDGFRDIYPWVGDLSVIETVPLGGEIKMAGEVYDRNGLASLRFHIGEKGVGIHWYEFSVDISGTVFNLSDLDIYAEGGDWSAGGGWKQGEYVISVNVININGEELLEEGARIGYFTVTETNDCDHSNYTDHYNAEYNILYDFKDSAEHYYRLGYDRICSDCGESWQVYSDEKTLTAAHVFDENGVCVCGYAQEKDETAPVIEAIKVNGKEINSKEDATFAIGTELTFSTRASDDIAMDHLKLFIDDMLMKTEPATGTVGEISYKADNLPVGTHEIKAIAYDAADWYTPITLTVEVYCPHLNTEVDEDSANYVQIDGNSEKHNKVCQLFCTDCDTLLDTTKTEEENHKWENGACSKCNYSFDHEHVPGSTKYIKHLFAAIDEKQHESVAIVWEAVCSLCNETYEHIDTEGDADNPLGLKYSHSWAEGKCQSEGCEYECLHPETDSNGDANFSDKYLNTIKIIDNSDGKTHLHTYNVKRTCLTCGDYWTEKLENVPEEHTIRDLDEKAEWDYDKEEHWKVVPQGCSCGYLDSNFVVKSNGPHEYYARECECGNRIKPQLGDLEITLDSKYFNPFTREMTIGSDQEPVKVGIWDEGIGQWYTEDDCVLRFELLGGNLKYENNYLYVSSAKDTGAVAQIKLIDIEENMVFDVVNIFVTVLDRNAGGLNQIESNRVTIEQAKEFSQEEHWLWLGDKGIEIAFELNIYNFEGQLKFDKMKQFSNGYYDVGFDAYNASPIVYGVSVYDEKGQKIGETQIINGYNEALNLMYAVDSLGTFAKDTITGNFGNWLKGETENERTKTSVFLEVPTGGYIRFEDSTTNSEIMWTNIANTVFRCYETAKALGRIKNPIMLDGKVFNMQTFADALRENSHNRQIIEDFIKACGKIATKNVVKGGAEAIKNIDLDEFARIMEDESLVKAVQECLDLSVVADSVGTGVTNTVANIALAANKPAYVMVNSTDAIVKIRDTSMMIHEMVNIYNNTTNLEIETIVAPNRY